MAGPFNGYPGIWVWSWKLMEFRWSLFLTEMVAESIGWAKSPFQIELAGYHLAYGLMSMLSLWNGNPGY